MIYSSSYLIIQHIIWHMVYTFPMNELPCKLIYQICEAKEIENFMLVKTLK